MLILLTYTLGEKSDVCDLMSVMFVAFAGKALLGKH